MRRWILRIAFGLGALVTLAVGAAATFVLTFDPADYKQDIAAAFEAATGQKLHFGGRLEADILTLRPAITLHDAALLNPPGFSRPSLASAARVHLVLRLRPLLRRRLAIIRIDIEGADVLFETNDKGERNWRKREAPALAQIPAPVPGIRIGVGQTVAGLTVDRLVLRRSRIGYLHGATGLETAVQLDEVTVNVPAHDKPITLAAAGAYRAAKIRAEGTVGTLAELLEPRPGPSFPVAFKLGFGRSQLELEAKVDLAARVPAATGTLTAKHIDLDELDPAAARGPPSDGRLFPAEPLPLGLLNAFDAEGEVKIESLVVHRQRLAAVAAKIALKGGDLALAPFAFTHAGARVQGDLRVNASGAVPAVAVRASGNGVRLREVTQMLFDVATVSSSLAFTVNVSGRGRTPREIAATLNGPVVIALGPGPIAANVLDFLSKDVFSIHRADALALVCAAARFDFARGVGSSQRIVIDTTRATAFGRGWVSLGSETLDMTFAPTTKGKSLASVAALVPVRVHGPIRRPATTPDLTRTPEEVMKSLIGVVELPGDIVSSIFGTRGSANARAGCGAAAAQAPARRGDDKTIIQRGGDVLKRINPF
jgi:uncharacterized protein involved in outer membrane biogenesis